MILTVTLNAAIDRTVAVPNFRLGHRHRAVEARTVAGGKGVNVARALKLLGRPVIATGLAGGPTGARLMERLAEESILTDFTRIAGESRTNLAVVDPTSGEQTEINERGPEVSAEEVERFLEKLLYLARGARICVIAGSLPPSVPASFSARIVEELKELGVETILDTEGEPMLAWPARRARRRSPRTCARPRGPSATSSTTARTRSAGCAAWSRWAPSEAVITRPAGCVASVLVDDDQRHAYEVTAPQLEPVATVGSGDAFLAGYVAARYDGRPPGSASPSGSPAAPSRPSTSAPAASTPPRSRRSRGGAAQARVCDRRLARRPRYVRRSRYRPTPRARGEAWRRLQRAESRGERSDRPAWRLARPDRRCEGSRSARQGESAGGRDASGERMLEARPWATRSVVAAEAERHRPVDWIASAAWLRTVIRRRVIVDGVIEHGPREQDLVRPPSDPRGPGP